MAINLKRISIIALVVLMTIVATFALQVSDSYAWNGYLEDCDFDACDDEFGTALPWPGFDETHGDAIPADWDGVAGSYIFKTPTTPSTPAPADSGKSGSSGNSSNTGNSSNNNSNASNNASSTKNNSSNSNNNAAQTPSQPTNNSGGSASNTPVGSVDAGTPSANVQESTPAPDSGAPVDTAGLGDSNNNLAVGNANQFEDAAENADLAEDENAAEDEAALSEGITSGTAISDTAAKTTKSTLAASEKVSAHGTATTSAENLLATKTENESTTFAGILILAILGGLAILTLLGWRIGKIGKHKKTMRII